MRNETEIRREVETCLKRRGLLLLDGGLWLAAVFFVWFTSYGVNGFPVLLLFVWTAVLGLHVLWTIYVEIRERLVNSAIERERQFYLLRDTYEKRKRSEERGRDEASLRFSDDGELIDYPDERKIKADQT